jgi:hypothetical protein
MCAPATGLRLAVAWGLRQRASLLVMLAAKPSETLYWCDAKTSHAVNHRGGSEGDSDSGGVNNTVASAAAAAAARARII